MINRSKHLPVYSILIGLLMVSVGFNIIFYHRISNLQDFIKGLNPWISVEHFDLMKTEINRLENEQYKIITKGE